MGALQNDSLRKLHDNIPHFIINMIFHRRIDVLNIGRIIHEGRHGADKVPAGMEHGQAGDAVMVERESMMHLHFTRDSSVIAAIEEHALTFHHLCDAFAAAFVEDGGVGHAAHGAAFDVGVVLVDLFDFACDASGFPANALVWSAGTAVKFADAAQRAVRADGPPSD